MNASRHAINPPFFSVRKAFTLVELLIVAVILVILAGLTLLAVNAAATAAKVERTRATILKIDAAILQIYTDYDTKLVRIQNRIAREHTHLTEAERHKLAVHFIRDLMRMEMPQSWAEISDSASTNDPKSKLPPIPYLAHHTAEPPVFGYYYQAYTKYRREVNAGNVRDVGDFPGRHSLLFLIVQNLNPEALEQFHASEIKDTNGDGLPEFVDAWGRPILFLRMAPAFPGSDLQPDVPKLAGYVPVADMNINSNWWKNPNKNLQDAFTAAAAAYPDPLDDHHLCDGWFLYPLIYSAGPDGEYDLISRSVLGDKDISPTHDRSHHFWDGILDPFRFPYGMPGNDGTRKLQHYDNIHNHRREKSF